MSHVITGPDEGGDYTLDGQRFNLAGVFHGSDLEPAEALRLLSEHLAVPASSTPEAPEPAAVEVPDWMPVVAWTVPTEDEPRSLPVVRLADVPSDWEVTWGLRREWHRPGRETSEVGGDELVPTRPQESPKTERVPALDAVRAARDDLTAALAAVDAIYHGDVEHSCGG